MFMSPGSIYMLCVADFECASCLSDIYEWEFTTLKLLYTIHVVRGAIQKFPKFEFCGRMVKSKSKYRYVSPHTPILNQWGKRRRVSVSV